MATQVVAAVNEETQQTSDNLGEQAEGTKGQMTCRMHDRFPGLVAKQAQLRYPCPAVSVCPTHPWSVQWIEEARHSLKGKDLEVVFTTC